jgi:alpha-tubulin suppressor-like RCC1 family protein
VTTGDRTYCWGGNASGQLGNGDPLRTSALTPVAVAGGLAFAQLGVGGDHTCGKTPAGVGYCWGDGFFGQLGNGTGGVGSFSLVPVPVAGPM